MSRLKRPDHRSRAGAARGRFAGPSASRRRLATSLPCGDRSRAGALPIGPGRYHIRQPGDALHEAREPLEVLEQIKAEIGSLKFSSQYQQQPVPAEGNLVRRGWFQPYDALPPQAYNRRLVQSWDVVATTGNSSDYSVCTTWLVCNGDFYLKNVFRERLVYPALRRKIIELAKEYDAQTILTENAGFGLNLLQDLSTEKPDWLPHPLGMKPLSTKLERLEAQTAKIEAGHLRSPKDAHWLDAFLHEMLAFSNARHDDQVDSVSQFLQWAAVHLKVHDIPFVRAIVGSIPRPSWWALTGIAGRGESATYARTTSNLSEKNLAQSGSLLADAEIGNSAGVRSEARDLVHSR